MYVLHSNTEKEFLSCTDFIDLRFDRSVAIFPFCTSYILKKKCLDGLTVSLHTDRLLLWFSASETGKSSITNYRRHTESIGGPKLSSHSIQLSRNQNRSNAATQSNAKEKKQKKQACSLGNEKQFVVSQQPSMKSLLQSVTSQSTHFPMGNSSVSH